ncbi:MAG TPA: fused MFS/spermidine synthase [Gemmatimonadaceae bacterium]|nr:fused MFS/spermidine synthase [Gemmatimonadaceae bacterium]
MLRALLLAAFILSGAAGLIYESVWSRYLGLFVGHSAYAQIIVLAVFLGGMAIGAAAIAKRSERIKQPLVWYAGVEIAVGLIGFLFHFAFGAITDFAYDAIFPSLSGGTLIAVKWAIAAVLILPQSILLGTTFPLMSAGAIRAERASGEMGKPPGHTLSILYFANSIGAAVGVLVAGFVLINWFGLRGTLFAAAFANLIAACIVYGVSELIAEDAPAPIEPLPAEPSTTEPDTQKREALLRALMMVAAGTAIASFIYEIAWVRMLSLVLGSATHSFELMLSAFIFGLSLGALWVRKRADTFKDPVRALAIVQWVMGVLALATVPLYLMSFTWTANLLEALARTHNGYTLFTFARYAFCLAVMLPATFCAGMTLPLITRIAMANQGGERAIGTVYSVNTLGSIIGAGVAGLVLIPSLGLKGTLIAGAIIDMLLGVYLVWRFLTPSESGRRLLLITSVGAAVVVANVVLTQHFDRGLLTAGVYRYAVAPARGTRVLAFYRDGRTATVSVRGDSDGGYSLATNGKPDASLTEEWLKPMAPSAPRKPIGGDQVTQAFLPLVTLAHAPNAQNAAIIGFGSGVSSHMLLGSPVLKELVTVEIEPAMVMASALFRAANKRVYDDPRSTIMIDDAKSYFASAGRRFDLIMSEPSNPWVSGVSGLFTDEFYKRVKRYLTDDGVFGQWLHLYEIDDALVTSVIAAVHRNFPAYEIFFASSVDILIVATPAQKLRAPDWNVARYPGISEDLTRFRQLSPRVFEALRVANRETFAPLFEQGEDVVVNSDYKPILDLSTEQTRFMRSTATSMIGLGTDRFPLGLVLAGIRTPFDTTTAAPVQINRIEALALGAGLRAAVVPPDTGTEWESLRESRHRFGLLRTQMAAGPPDNWRQWLRHVLTVDEALHGGTSGVADSAFYAQVIGYATRYHAPERVSMALRFMRAASAWDWPTVDSVGKRVIELGSESVGLAVSGDIVRDAVVVAKLRLGDPTGARNIYNLLAGHGTRIGTDLRMRLLWAAIQHADTTTARTAGKSSPP